MLQGENGHMRGDVCLKTEVSKCGLESPETITSTKLRKYMATVSQVTACNDMIDCCTKK